MSEQEDERESSSNAILQKNEGNGAPTPRQK
jgi:hypothetical protein